MNKEMTTTAGELDGCDGGDAGCPEAPSIWLFGIEHGIYRSIHDPDFSAQPDDQTYSVETQLQWPYNQKAYKLLAAIAGEEVDDYVDFAKARQPFVKHARGYFKGNLYPYSCRSTSDWPAQAQLETGMSKVQYRDWCREHHFPLIRSLIDRHQPKIFIGVGITCRAEFSRALFGDVVPLDMHRFEVNGHWKTIFHAQASGRRLVVVPHLSGGQYGLNSNESLRIAGKFIADFIEARPSGS